jgi:hypothetical protein
MRIREVRSWHEYSVRGLDFAILAARPHSMIWGCDFRPTDGDFGDPDLRIAIDHAR